MREISKKPKFRFLLALLAMQASASVFAQVQDSPDPSIVVSGERPPTAPVLTAGPEIKGVITARNGDKMKVATADGSSTIIAINDTTRIKTGGSLFGGNRGKLGKTRRY